MLPTAYNNHIAIISKCSGIHYVTSLLIMEPLDIVTECYSAYHNNDIHVRTQCQGYLISL